MTILSHPRMLGTAFTREEAARALAILNRAIDSDAGFQLARECGAVAAIFGALVILDDYVANSHPEPLGYDQANRTAARPSPERADRDRRA